METLAFLAVVINVLIFSSALALNILFAEYASYIRLILTLILWAFTILIVFERKALKSWELHLPNQILFLLLSSFIVMLAVSAAVSPAPIVATFYSGLTYLSFYPFTYLFLIIRKNPILTKRILLIFTILCVFLSLGVIYDATVGLQNAPFVNSRIIAAIDEFAIIDENGQQRGGFFFGSSTVVYPFLSIGILSIILLSKLFRYNKLNWLAALSIPIIWLGCFFTFSRAPLILCTVFSIYAFIELVVIDQNIKLSHKTILLLVFVILVGLFAEIRDFLYEQAGSYQVTRFESTFSQGETGNYIRIMGWKEGLKLFDLLEAWRGYGLGTSNTRMGEIYDFPVRSHFESSIFLTFSEGGVFGLFARLLPLVVTFWLCQGTVVSRLFSVWMLLFFVNLCVSPLIDGHSVQLAYFLAMALCLAFAPLLKNNKFNEID
ncbi:MAG: hypothetical protein KME01_00240 [Chroococcus sp. CMT-3BRIN-NPC107]|jgi:hypothetical protein|nr:hypothetical protein [Chroococcus sp. CMT-3BRIN-NPC107]